MVDGRVGRFHSFVTNRWKEKLINLTASGAMKDIGVVVTSQLRYSQPEKVMCAQAFQKKNQVGVKVLLAKVNAEQGNITVMVTAPVLSRTAFFCVSLRDSGVSCSQPHVNGTWSGP